MNMRNACAHNRLLEPFNFTVVPNIVLETEVSTIEEEIIVEEELVTSEIIASR